jgi:hypothetical protein
MYTINNIAFFYVYGSVHHESIFVSVQRVYLFHCKISLHVSGAPDDGCKKYPKHVERSCSEINRDC